jgi:hypothetical protein
VREYPKAIAEEYYEILRSRRILVPLRNPREVWKSWVNRIEEDRGPVPLYLFEPQWRHIDEFYHPNFKLEYHCLSESEVKTGHVEPSAEYDYFNPDAYLQPDWDSIYSMTPVRQYYAPGP